jgi:transcriptional regulator with PAS, ATPase and Fis domain
VDGKDMVGPEGLALFISSQSGVLTVPLSSTEPTVLGRDGGCDVVINDESVSRKHAVIVPGTPPELEDLGSTNGTFLAGREIEPHSRVPLAVGSVAQLGMATIVLQKQRPQMQSQSATLPPPPPTIQMEGDRIVVDPMMQSLYRALSTIGPTTLSVLILGETGTGKEVFAEAVHQRSRRANEPFLKLNCGALPESILESELFGHEKGAFTGAVAAKQGLFESADGGTVFLDEVGELSRATQVKLLRVLETGEVLRIGSVKPKKVDVRLVSATNQNLNHLVAASEFRTDLLFRINGFTVTLPPLRERLADIGPLARFFAARAAARAGVRAPELTLAAIQALKRFSWPGNIRELRNVMERSVALCPPDATSIDIEHLLLPQEEVIVPISSPPSALAATSSLAVFSDNPMSDMTMESVRLRPPPFSVDDEPTQPRLRQRLQVFERERIEEALKESGGHQGRAANLLGISRRTLFNKMEQFGIRRPRGSTDAPPPSSKSMPPSSQSSPPSSKSVAPSSKTSPPAAKTSPPAAKTSPPAAKTSPPAAKTSPPSKTSPPKR